MTIYLRTKPARIARKAAMNCHAEMPMIFLAEISFKRLDPFGIAEGFLVVVGFLRGRVVSVGVGGCDEGASGEREQHHHKCNSGKPMLHGAAVCSY